MFAEEGRRKKEEGRRKKEEGRRKKEEGRKSRISAIHNILTVGSGCYNTKRLLWFNGLQNNCFELRMLNCKLPEPDRALPFPYR